VDLPPFMIRFETFKYFKHSKSCTLWLHPEPSEKVLQLQSNLELLFPYCDDLSTKSDDGYTPHLSVGQFSKSDIQNVCDEFQSNWQTIEFEVKYIYFISRINEDPFEIRYSIPLGGIGQILPGRLLTIEPPDNTKQTMFIGNLLNPTTEEEILNFF